ncbi:stalk domain-containing protein [Paenibacillus sp. TAB 01]|uniref:stalk domain-containing protein n=1 Tax=Paenibacillus sp. TAB 01 TaxID=3368988 RepID=UPI00375164E3
MADEKLRVTQQLYTAKFGAGRMKALERMAKSKAPDTELFMAQYDATLEQIRQEWEGFFQLPGLFPIPKSLFQGERDGLRYLDDLRNGLPIALMEQGKAQLKEQESRTAVTDKVRQSYLEAKGAEESYAQALRDQEAASAKLDKVNAALKAGLLKTEDLQAAKDAQEQAKQQVLTAYIAYKVAAGKLDLDSGGAVSRTVRPGVLPYREVDSGLDAVKAAAAELPDGTWELKPAVGTVLSELTLKAKGKLKATDYALYTAEGHPLGGKTPVGKPLRHLSLSFSEPSKLRVQLYNGDELLGEARLEGRGSSGELKLAGPEDAASGNPLPATTAPSGTDDTTIKQDQIMIGTYRMALDALTPEVYNAAAATMAGSGQGVYFAPAWAEGRWFGLDQALDSSALTMQGPDSAALPPEQAAALQVTMELPAPGQLTTPLSAEQLQQSIAELSKAKEQLEASRQAAVEAHQPAAAAELEIQQKDAAAQIAMLDALSKGDTGTALQQMALVHNADALMAAIAAEDSGTAAGDGAGTGSGGADGSASGSGATGTGANTGGAGTGTAAGGGTPGAADSGIPSQAALEAEQQRSKQALQAALAAGDAASALAQAKQLLAAAQQLAALEDGSADEQAALAAAQSKLQAALAAAEQAHDAAQAETLGRTLESVRQAAVQAEKDALFGKLGALEAAGAALASAAPPEAGTPQAEAKRQLDGYLTEQEAALLADIGKKELEKYSEAQLQALSAQADEVKAADEQAVPMPIQQLVSKDFQVVLDTPPILLDGRAYVPVRALSESLGASVDWDPERLAVTVSSEEGTAECTVGSTTAYVDGAAAELDAPPVLIAGYTYVPLRFIGEAIGLQIQWYEAAGTIQISKP